MRSIVYTESLIFTGNPVDGGKNLFDTIIDTLILPKFDIQYVVGLRAREIRPFRT